MSENSTIISYIIWSELNVKTVSKQIVNRIRNKGRGWVFTPKDFLDLGNRAAIDQTLSRLVQTDDQHRSNQGLAVRRLHQGLYDFPKYHSRMGLLSPAPDAIADAVARKTGGKWQVSSTRAANAVGLTTQVPAKPNYFIQGAPKKIKIGQLTINFRKASSRQMIGAGTSWGTVLRALDYLGKDGITNDVVAKLANKLSDKDIVALQKNSYAIPDWKRNLVNRISNLR